MTSPAPAAAPVRERRYTCVETAKLIRATLKARFPGTKFSVRSDSYAGGASVTVRWTDGPPRAAVERITDRFEGKTFDARIDLASYKSAEVIGPDGSIERVSYGSDYVSCSREISQTEWDRCAPAVLRQLGLSRIPVDINRPLPVSPYSMSFNELVRQEAEREDDQ